MPARLLVLTLQRTERRLTKNTFPTRLNQFPFAPRPIDASSWRRWLVDDQREQSGRPDVLAYKSEVLKAPVKISGQPIVNMTASTSGTDSDWVVKLIDLYPNEVAAQPNMGGYQLMISADVLRGRYREGFETAKPIAANKPLQISLRACRLRITCFCPVIESWCRSSRAGSRSTTVIRRRLLRVSSGPSPKTTRKRRNGSITRSGWRVTSSCHW